MIEPIIFSAALVFVFMAGQMGMKAGAFPALARMIGVALSFFIAMRYWFPLSRLAAAHDSSSILLVTIVVFWAVFLVVFVIILKLCEARLQIFESVQPSLFGRLIGAALGGTSGAVIAAMIMMTLSLLAPKMPFYKPAALPFRIDSAPEMFFRLVETRLGRVQADDPARTLLPKLENAGSSDPAAFWE